MEQRGVKGQSLALSAWPCSPEGFPPSLPPYCGPLLHPPSPPSTILPLLPPLPAAHLHTFINALRRRRRGSAGWSMQRTHYRLDYAAVCPAADRSRICEHLGLCSGPGARRTHTHTHASGCVVYIYTYIWTHFFVCVHICVCARRDETGPSSPTSTPSIRTTLLTHRLPLSLPASLPFPPPPTHTSPHFACVILASWPCWLIPLH